MIDKEKKRALQNAMATIKKKYGEDAFREPGEISNVEGLPTGSLLLDSEIGIGGIPRGRITEIYGGESSGKAQPLYSKVITPNGEVQMKDLSLGDLVSTPDGGASPVLGIFPQGEKDIYKITFSDGSSTKSCGEHLWNVFTHKDKANGDGFRILSLNDIEKDYRKKTRLKYMIPISEPVDFIPREIDIDPYVMGILLGDGSFRDVNVKVSSSDSFIIEYLSMYADSNDMVLKHVSKYDYSFKKKISGFDKTLVKKKIIDYNLDNRYSYEKFIPNDFLVNSLDNRVSLLQGLMDSDGTVSSGTLSYCTTSKKMASQIRWLIQSLGGRAHVGNKNPYYYKDGRKIPGKLAYIISILLPSEIIPFRLKRKNKLIIERVNDFKTRYISNIEYDGKEECQCIYIDHPDHLYLTDDFIVTHNTTLITTICVQAQKLEPDAYVAVVDIEHAFDPIYAKKLGLDLENMIFTQPDSAEEALDTMLSLISSSACSVVVLDSVGGLQTKLQLEKGIGEATMAEVARVLSQTMPKIVKATKRTNTVTVFVNQIRDNIGVYKGGTTTMGGKALKFFSSLRIELKRREVLTEGDTPIGQVMRFKIAKNKVGSPFGVFDTNLFFGYGFDMKSEVVDLAIEKGIIKQGGAWFSFGENKFQGKVKVIEFLRTDDSEYEKIKDLVFSDVNEELIYSDEDDIIINTEEDIK